MGDRPNHVVIALTEDDTKEEALEPDHRRILHRSSIGVISRARLVYFNCQHQRPTEEHPQYEPETLSPEDVRTTIVPNQSRSKGCKVDPDDNNYADHDPWSR